MGNKPIPPSYSGKMALEPDGSTVLKDDSHPK